MLSEIGRPEKALVTGGTAIGPLASVHGHVLPVAAGPDVLLSADAARVLRLPVLQHVLLHGLLRGQLLSAGLTGVRHLTGVIAHYVCLSGVMTGESLVTALLFAGKRQHSLVRQVVLVQRRLTEEALAGAAGPIAAVQLLLVLLANVHQQLVQRRAIGEGELALWIAAHVAALDVMLRVVSLQADVVAELFGAIALTTLKNVIIRTGPFPPPKMIRGKVPVKAASEKGVIKVDINVFVMNVKYTYLTLKLLLQPAIRQVYRWRPCSDSK